MAGNGDNGALPYRWAILRIEDLVVDETYQRDLKPSLVKEIREDFNPSLVGVVTANERKRGTVALIDGQHRTVGMAERGMEEVPAVVFEGLTRAEEAQLFSDLQTKRKGITSVEKFKARLASNEKPAKEILRISEESGWEIGGNQLRCIAELDKLYRRDGEGVILYRTLRSVKRAWPEAVSKEAARGSVISGVGRFIAEQDPDDERLISRLARNRPADVLARADDLRRGKGSGTATIFVTEVVTAIYTSRELKVK